MERITRKEIYILEGHTFTQRLRMDQENTMLPEPALYEAAFMSYGLHVGVPVNGRHNFLIYILDGHTFTQNMRMDQGNTMRPEPALYKAAFMSYGLH